RASGRPFGANGAPSPSSLYTFSMPVSAPPDQLVVAISSRALFDFEEENAVFESADDHAYMRLQYDRLDEPAKPGVAFRLVKKLLAFNADDVKRVEVVILSRNDPHPAEVRIAFDGDAVIFADEAERVFRQHGLDAFQTHEADHATRPLPPGPFKPLLEALHRLQRVDATGQVKMKLRTALVTARSAPAHERAIRTLIDWNVNVDEAMFLGGFSKGPFLREFEPDFYFDDQTRHVESAAAHVPSGHVPHGIANA